MKNIILVFGATYNQVPLVRKIQEAGHIAWVTAAGDVSQHEGIADKVLQIDTSDKDRLLNIVLENNIKGLITCGTSTAICTIAYINEKAGLSDKVIPYEVALNATLKNNFRRILSPHGVIPSGDTVSNIDELSKISGYLKFPIVFKPVDAGGGKGIEIVNDDSREHLREAFNRSISYSPMGKLIMEEYIDGIVLGVESMTVDGTTQVLAVAEKNLAGFPNCVTTGLFFPSPQLKEHLENIIRTNNETISRLGIVWGPTHIDMVLKNDGELYVIDVGPRLAGGPIAAALIKLATGSDYYQASIDLCIGKDIELPDIKAEGATIYGSHFSVRDVKGRISSIKYDEELVDEYELRDFRLLKKIGDTTNGITTDSDRLSVFHFRAESMKEMEQKIKVWEDNFHIEVIPT